MPSHASNIDLLIRIYSDMNKEIENALKSRLLSLKIKDDNLNEFISKIIYSSTELLITRWKSQRKTIRSSFFNNIKSRDIRLSIAFDSIINLLDAFYDNELNETEKGIALISLISNLGFSYSNFDKDSAEYFRSIMLIAISEKFYAGKLLSLKDKDEFVNAAVNAYKIRSLDNDIFCKLLHNPECVNASRRFRAINLLAKDLKDLNFDLKTGSLTPVVIINKQGKPMKDYIKSILEELLNWNINSIKCSFFDKQLHKDLVYINKKIGLNIV